MDRYPHTLIALAAGEGKRLKPHTERTPKPLLKYKDKAVIDYLLESVSNTQLKRLIFVLGYLKEHIQSHLNSQDLNTIFCYQNKLSGTADALKAATTHASTNSGFIIITACDYIFPKDYISDLIKFHTEGQHDISISLRRVNQQKISSSSLTKFDALNNITRIIEKPNNSEIASDEKKLSSSLIYIVPVNIFGFLPNIHKSIREEFEITDAINNMLTSGYSAKGLIQSELFDWETDYITQHST